MSKAFLEAEICKLLQEPEQGSIPPSIFYVCGLLLDICKYNVCCGIATSCPGCSSAVTLEPCRSVALPSIGDGPATSQLEIHRATRHCNRLARKRTGAGVVYRARLESVCAPKGHRGFESLPVRQRAAVPLPNRCKMHRGIGGFLHYARLEGLAACGGAFVSGTRLGISNANGSAWHVTG